MCDDRSKRSVRSLLILQRKNGNKSRNDRDLYRVKRTLKVILVVNNREFVVIILRIMTATRAEQTFIIYVIYNESCFLFLRNRNMVFCSSYYYIIRTMCL